MRFLVVAFVALFGLPFATVAESVPTAIFTDPVVDAAHPAAMTVLHIPTHGVTINGLVYSPPGAGPHPTLLICHGLPGNEKNLDLAQAARRAGWNAVTFNYRGTWGSAGKFRFTQVLEDADAALAYLRDPMNAAKLGVDVKRIAIVGHSMGGWVVAHTASHDHGLIGAIMISAADMGALGAVPRKDRIAVMADDMETLTDVTAESMADEVAAHSKEFRFAGLEAGLKGTPLLVVTSNDGLAPHADALTTAIKVQGGTQVTALHIATDHSYSDRRIALESTILTWLEKLK